MSGWTILPKEVYDEITQTCPECDKQTEQKMDGDLAIKVSCECGWGERLVLRSELAQGKEHKYKPPIPSGELMDIVLEAYEKRGECISMEWRPLCVTSAVIPEPAHLQSS